MNFLDVIVKARRYLRDPEALIWDAEQLCLYYNEAQIEIAQKTGLITRARTMRYPSQTAISYMWDWEYEHTHGDKLPVIKPFRIFEQLTITDHSGYTKQGAVMLYPWEATYNTTAVDSVDEYYRNTQYWEAYYVSTAEPPRVILNENIDAIRYAAMDETTIEFKPEKDIALQDPYYKTTEGESAYYYFPDDYHNQLVVYPISTIRFAAVYLMANGQRLSGGITVADSYSAIIKDKIFKDTVSFYSDKAHCHSWEYSSSHAGADTYRIGHYNSTHQRQYIHDWEYDVLEVHEPTKDPDTYEIMYYWEYPDTTGTLPGFTATNDEEDTVTEPVLERLNNLFLIYDYLPSDVEDYAADLSDWPPYLMQVIIAGMLERAYSADTDGFIPSLRDFWKMKKDMGIMAMKIFRQHKYRDRDYRLGGGQRTAGVKRYPRLPSTYPATYP